MSGSENRDAILKSLEDRGVLYDLIDGVFRYCDEHGVLSLNEETGIDVCRASLTEYLRRKRGLCITCAATPRPATRPCLDGFEDRQGTYGGSVAKEAPAHLKQQYPCLWCEDCWNLGNWATGLVREDAVPQE